MGSKIDVGRSYRTPAKHKAMYEQVASEICAANKLPSIFKIRYYDLTAGDGIVDPDLEWSRNCSPGIIALCATYSEKPIDVFLFEIQTATYDRLLEVLNERLPEMGYSLKETRTINEMPTTIYTHENVVLNVINGSGYQAWTTGVNNATAVFFTNDPNAITTWAMRANFAKSLASACWAVRGMSTMGCNADGIKRLPITVRNEWYGHVQDQINALHDHHDLLIVEIEKDKAQWAYLFHETKKWRKKLEGVVDRSFTRQGLTVNQAWFRTDHDRFTEIVDRLFLTKRERGS